MGCITNIIVSWDVIDLEICMSSLSVEIKNMLKTV